MDEKLIQRNRYLLHAKVRRVNKAHTTLFEKTIKQLFTWLDNHPMFNPIIKRIESIENDIQTDLINFEESLKDSRSSTPLIIADTIEGHIFLCIKILRMCIETGDKNDRNYEHRFYNRIVYMFSNEDTYKIDEQLDLIKEIALEGLFEYLDEQLESRNAIYGLLLKYKQRSEWFKKTYLIDISENGADGPSGERGLARDLQEYIFDQGVEFSVEPVSSRGEVDLVLKDPDGRDLLIDAKYIKEDASKSEIIKKLAEGFHQVQVYCNDYNEPEGYLVAYIRTKKRISIELSESDGLPFISIGGKTIYYCPVLISEEPSASKVGKAKEVNISVSELKTVIEDQS